DMLHSRPGFQLAFAAALASLALFLPAHQRAFAQQAELTAEQQMLWRQYAAQQAELEALRAKLDAPAATISPASFETMSLDTAAEGPKKEEAKGPAEYEIGSDLKMATRWDPNNGVTFESGHKDFISHIGVRTQLDFVGFGETSALAKSSFGRLQDGAFF